MSRARRDRQQDMDAKLWIDTVWLDGLVMGESPRWHDGRFWVADWMAHRVLAVDADGRREVVAEVEAVPISIDWAADGSLLVVAGSDGELRRLDAEGRWSTLA